MAFHSRLIAVAAFLLSLFALGAVTAQASPGGEPSLSQIYQAANANEIARAQRMVDEVLQKHPQSAKAHYVKSELSARQHNYVVAREELATAEKLQPGLPFVRSESLQSLRGQLAQAPVPGERATTRTMGAAPETGPPAAAPATWGLPWGAIALAALAVGLVAALVRRRAGSRDRADENSAGSGSRKN